MPHFAAIHMGFHWMPKYPFSGFQYTKGYDLSRFTHFRAALLIDKTLCSRIK